MSLINKETKIIDGERQSLGECHRRVSKIPIARSSRVYFRSPLSVGEERSREHDAELAERSREFSSIDIFMNISAGYLFSNFRLNFPIAIFAPGTIISLLALFRGIQYPRARARGSLKRFHRRYRSLSRASVRSDRFLIINSRCITRTRPRNCVRKCYATSRIRRELAVSGIELI